MTNITYYGHSAFMVEVNNTKLLFDPFISGNDATKAKIDLNQIVPDYILLTHGHQDHILDAESISKQTGAPIIANFEVASWYQKMGLENAMPMNHGGTLDINGIKIKMVNAVHTSSFPDGTYAGQPAGFVISWDKGSFYYSGDTALMYDMKLIGEEFDLDFAFLCIGDHFTMGVKDAIKAADFIGADHIIGMHFDTFDPIKIDHKDVTEAFSVANKTLRLLNIGETISV